MHVYTSVSCMVSSFLQCATHINLGWRIRVVDSVEEYVANEEWPNNSTCPDLPPATTATSETTEDSDTSFCPDLPAETTATVTPQSNVGRVTHVVTVACMQLSLVCIDEL